MSFCADMTQLTMKTKLNLTDICDLLDVTAQLALTARQHEGPGLSPTTQHLLHSLVKLLCKQLWTQRNHLTASNSAVTLTALSRTGTHPDTMPGLADALAEQFIADTECHNAYRYIQALYSCTQMNIDPCEGRLREHVLQRFPKLSLAKTPSRLLTNMLYAVAARPAGLLSPAAAHPTANITALETKAAHKVCTRLTRMLSSSKSEDQCTEDDMASSLRSLRALKHKPKDEFAAAFSSWYAQLLGQLQNESPPQSSCRLPTILATCVDLRLKLPANIIPILVPHIDGISKWPAKAAACAMSAWASAASGILDIQSLELLLHAQGKHEPPWPQLPWSVTDLAKVFQAVDWLQPDSVDSPDHGRWTVLCHRVAGFGARPIPSDAAPPPMLSALHAVLDEQSVAYSSNVQLGSCVAPAVVEAQGNMEGALVLDFVTAAYFFVNEPDRWGWTVLPACASVLCTCLSVHWPAPSTCLSAGNKGTALHASNWLQQA